MGGGSKHSIPILDYFSGKPVHKLYSRGVPIVPVFIGAPIRDAYMSNWRFSRASQPGPRCEIHGEQSRPSTPSGSEPSDSSSSRKCCPNCPSKGIDPDTSRRKKTRQRGHAQKPSGHPACFGWASSSSSSTKVAAPMAHSHLCHPFPGTPGVATCSQDHIYDYHHPVYHPAPACPHHQVETTRDAGLPQAKCSCRPQPQQPVTPPEFDIRHHCYCGSDDCRSDNASFYTMDDAVSESSVEAVPGSEKGGVDGVPHSGGYHCYHPVYVAFPCGPSGME